MSSPALDIIVNYRTCEFTTLFRDGSPQTWPVSPLLLADGRFLLCTSIGLPQKAFNIRRNPKVSMLFSEPTGSGLTKPGAVLIRGDAIAEDGIVADMMAKPDLATLIETVFAPPARRRPHEQLARSAALPFYYVRILIHVTPRRGFFWPTRDFAEAPQEFDITELNRVD